MSFSVKTSISECESFESFLERWQVDAEDLIFSSPSALAPYLKGKALPCDVLDQRAYGKGEPSDEMVDAVLADIEKSGKHYARIIAIGGGTVIDIAKLCVFGPGLRCEEIFAKGAALPRKRQLLVIPTTCGTGSEVTNISIVAFLKKQTKLGLAIPALFPDEAVLIAGMLANLPYEVFATSSIDALVHAVESYVSPKANPFTRALGGTAIELILKGYQELTPNSTPSKNLLSFLNASTMAGIAFGNAGCAAVHALAYPIGAIYHVPHGKANYLVFEKVFAAYKRLNADLSPLETLLAAILNSPQIYVWQELFALLDRVLKRQPLRELSIDEKQCLEMAASVVQNQQRLLGNNPIPFSQEVVEEIYKNSL
jgi:4-hydroxybutyrate dehydrogenase